ncbi:hypothetical protein GLOIN_2v1787648 [Rhizophagus irregularis DAOM 181602=DAOM 197198]|uniref:Uncharacterized protein n=1 Tax=Rhizophagus irregularis (strain DAOM 181602 / DAOM 197198 / MUCL 43194) TaxID=747089 RepID=A0A2P4P5E5_RHIID|nr:hypothetical protein GLOIN_2v1787648 [Rhizophagus irregularis DAOM 181602=DAOM 197198]POG60609.1 hypothetical protein GLOIN_2v1787648 [Rhizophagus irregularis DAOM 181602=DAOM 197198]GBC45409.2 hypothetical protein GLOIN_2v1787648 [Rhizophagus irregularis DAOM 181602=DAOM 197198]|eukprot:XP_025167475.1 hypothetical protein GLOIN_2v1787648 [Rhizophagus irregularis DAOM 181602=DAOM 197198]
MGNPFIISTGNYKFIEIYLNNLNSDLKSKLKEYKINYNLLPSKTIFNYHNFIKSLDTRKIKSSTVKWTNNIIRTLKLDLFNDIDLKTDFIGLIQTSLFKMFIENEVIIHTLSIEISNYDFYQNEISFIHQIFNLAKPFKLKSLFIDEKSQIDESLKLLLQKFGGYLENIGCKYSHSIIRTTNTKIIIAKIWLYCKNTKFLELYEFKEHHKHYLSIDLIENIKQNLNYLSINANSIILRNLGQALPFKLKYLSLNLINNLIDLEIFLKNSQNTLIENY